MISAPAIPARAVSVAISPQRMGMGLLLLAEAMLFSGFVAAYVVLRAGSGSLFAKHAMSLNKGIGIVCVLALVAASLILIRARSAAASAARNRLFISHASAIVLGLGVLVLFGLQWTLLLNHVTAIAVDRTSKIQYVYDGTIDQSTAAPLVIRGRRVDARQLPPLDIHRFSAVDLPVASSAIDSYDIVRDDATVMSYGPWKSPYFACYFLLTGVIAVHLVAAMLAGAVVIGRARRGRSVAALAHGCATYWGFVAAMMLLITILLYWPQL